MADVASQLWNYCHTLRHDGMDYGDYIEQLTFLLFLKMADERDIPVPDTASWEALRSIPEDEILDTYKSILEELSQAPGILGDIYSDALSRFSNGRNLSQLIVLIDTINWSDLNIDIQAAAFEGLLEKSASEGKKGSGQYFTPRVLIESMVRVTKPDPVKQVGMTVCDPACGTAGFLIAANDWLMTSHNAISDSELSRIRQQTYYGTELVKRPRRLALMNLYLHSLAGNIRLGDAIYGEPDSKKYDVILTNPPFGRRGGGEFPDGAAFKIRTTSKQLNFVQLIVDRLKAGGRAAVVLPDNALFDDRASEVFYSLMTECNLHTVLRCPSGTFSPYTEGTNTNVVFFVKGRPTEITWIYDARANLPKVTKRSRPLSEDHFAEFESCFGDDPYGDAARREEDSAKGRWKAFTLAEITARHFKLDALRWIREDADVVSDVIPEPQELLTAASESLSLAVDSLKDLQLALDGLGFSSE